MEKQRAKKTAICVAVPLLAIYLFFKFFFAFYRMPDQTMEATIEKGEMLVVNKIAFGDYFLGFKMPGLSKVERGDLVYILDPSDIDAPLYSRRRIVARVVALPHDNYELDRRVVVTNGEEEDAPATLKQSHRVVARQGVSLDSAFFASYGISEQLREGHKTEMHDKYRRIYRIGSDDDIEIWDVPLTRAQADELAADSLLSYVRMVRSTAPSPTRVIKVWPYSGYWFWNRWNTSPVFEVPGKGTVVPVNYRSIKAYEEIIERYEGNKLDAALDNRFFINGQLANSYTVKENYYIVLSDNRDRFYDSRTWGLVPESHIVGRVMKR